MESLRIAHKHFKVNQKTVFKASDTLSRYERIEYLWNLLREHTWKIGRERVLEKRRIAEQIKEFEEQRVEAQVALQEGGGRRKSVRSEGTGGKNEGIDGRRQSMRTDGIVGGRRNSELLGNRRKSVQTSR